MENSVKIEKIEKDFLYEDTEIIGSKFILRFVISSIKLKIKIEIRTYNKSDLKYADIVIYDIFYSAYITRHLEFPTLDKLESITYELIGRYFGIYTGSKPKDLKYFEFEDTEDKDMLEDLLVIKFT